MVLLRSTVTVGSFTMVSRVLGFCRDILIATFLGAGVIADVFFVAFKAPNLFRRLFAEGAFNAAFVPQFAGILEYNGKIQARVFAEQALSILLWSTLIFVVCVQILMPYLMVGLAPGFTNDTEQFNLAVLLTRITFPYLLFISMASLMSGVLNSLGKFAAAAATPVLLNICLISSLIILARYTDTPAHALAWGVTIAGVIQFIWLLFNCGWAGFWLRLIRPQFTKDICKMTRRILPAAVGAGVYQISLLIDTIIASLLPSGSISFLFFADRVNQLPLGVVGVAVGTALLPLMSRQLSVSDYKGALDSQNRAIELSLFLTLPAAVSLVLLSEPTISVLFERGAFDAAAAKSTAEALAMYAIGLPAYVVIKALVPGFFAREDTATPVKIAVFSLLINLILNLILMDPFLHKGIAAATAISAWCNALGLAFVLKRRGYFSLDKRNTVRLPRMVMASLLMGVMLFFSLIFLNKVFVYETPIKLYILVTLVFAGLIIYLSFSFLIVAAKWSEFKQLFQRSIT